MTITKLRKQSVGEVAELVKWQTMAADNPNFPKWLRDSCREAASALSSLAAQVAADNRILHDTQLLATLERQRAEAAEKALADERIRSTALEGDRVELQAKTGHLEQKLADSEAKRVADIEHAAHICDEEAARMERLGAEHFSIESHRLTAKAIRGIDAAIDAASKGEKL